MVPNGGIFFSLRLYPDSSSEILSFLTASSLLTVQKVYHTSRSCTQSLLKVSVGTSTILQIQFLSFYCPTIFSTIFKQYLSHSSKNHIVEHWTMDNGKIASKIKLKKNRKKLEVMS